MNVHRRAAARGSVKCAPRLLYKFPCAVFTSLGLWKRQAAARASFHFGWAIAMCLPRPKEKKRKVSIPSCHFNG